MDEQHGAGEVAGADQHAGHNMASTIKSQLQQVTDNLLRGKRMERDDEVREIKQLADKLAAMRAKRRMDDLKLKRLESRIAKGNLTVRDILNEEGDDRPRRGRRRKVDAVNVGTGEAEV
jgi:hypothetical protein